MNRAAARRVRASGVAHGLRREQRRSSCRASASVSTAPAVLRKPGVDIAAVGERNGVEDHVRTLVLVVGHRHAEHRRTPGAPPRTPGPSGRTASATTSRAPFPGILRRPRPQPAPGKPVEPLVHERGEPAVHLGEEGKQLTLPVARHEKHTQRAPVRRRAGLSANGATCPSASRLPQAGCWRRPPRQSKGTQPSSPRASRTRAASRGTTPRAPAPRRRQAAHAHSRRAKPRQPHARPRQSSLR